MGAPQTSKAIIKVAAGKATVQELPTPKVRDGHVIVKTKAVSINPTDWKGVHNDSEATFGTKIGCDFAGEVVEVGAGVSNFKVGDRIAGLSPGADILNKETGSYGEYLLAQADVQFHNSLSDEEGATLGVSVFTVGQGLYQNLKLQLPTNPITTPTPILIYGGSTASGLWGIQFAKLSGYKVITTASPRNFDYLKSLGADAVFDYNSPTVVGDIIAAAGGELALAWDCISQGESYKISAASFSPKGGKLGLLLPVNVDEIHAVNPNVEAAVTMAYSIFGNPFQRGISREGSPEDHAFAKKFRDVVEPLLREGKLKAPKIELNRGGSGLEGVLVGLEELRQGKVSASKLIYTI
ncbi:chaperonin 10-like protein [Trichoderma sp. SZMC 28014]